jgi:hypothetical protein
MRWKATQFLAFGPILVPCALPGVAQTEQSAVDIRVTDRVSLRTAHVDWLLLNFFGCNRWEFRYSTGIVIEFGRK